MDHNYINKSGLIDRYLMGMLAEDETIAFEEHFVDCPECIDQLKTTERFRHDLRLAVVQNSSLDGPSARFRPFEYVRRVFSGKLLSVAAAAAMMFVLLAALGIYEIIKLRSEVVRTKDLSAQWEIKFEQQRRSAEESEKKHEETEQQLNGQLNALEAKLQNHTEGGPAGLITPQINIPFLLLKSVRGGNPSPEDNEITLPKSAQIFIITLSLQGEKYKEYRMTITDDHTQTVCKKGGLVSDINDALLVGFGSNLFNSGDYQLVLEGSNNRTDFTPVGTYPFHVIKK